MEFRANLATSLWLFCTLLAAIGCLYALFAAWCAAALGRAARGQPMGSTPPNGWPSVSILKPLYGAETDLLAHLSSFCRQDYPGRFEVVLGVQRPDDPAVDVVEALVGRYPELDIRLVKSAALHGTNRKISNLININAAARHEVVVLADSDMRVGPDYLTQIVGALHQPGVGLVTCLYRGLPLAGLWSRLSAMAIDHHFLPSVLVGMRLGLAKPCFGSTIALRRETLDRIGGFQAFRDQLADDYAMGAAVRGLGLAVTVPPLVVAHACTEGSAAELYAHELRWQRTIRLVDPAGFLGAVVTHPVPLSLAAAVLGVAAGAHPASSIGLILAALACRLLVQIQVDRSIDAASARGGAAELPARTAWELVVLGPVRDCLSFAVYVASFLPGTLTWRGTRFDVHRDGTMAETGRGEPPG